MKRGLVLLVFLSLLSCSEKVISHLDTKAKFQNFDSYTIVNAKIGKRQLPAETTELLGSANTGSEDGASRQTKKITIFSK